MILQSFLQDYRGLKAAGTKGEILLSGVAHGRLPCPVTVPSPTHMPTPVKISGP